MPPAPLATAMYQAIVLAGGDDRRLHPLTSSSVKALMPVANKPLISYALAALRDAGLPKVFVVVMGEEAARAIQDWVNKEYPANGRMHCEVIKAKESQGTADALRTVADKVTAKTVVVVSGDLLTDFPINALVAKHQMDGALATALLFRRKVSPTTETKPGKAPKNVDYIGLDSTGERLLFYASSQDALKDLKVPLGVVRGYGCMTIASDLVDAHLYVFDKPVLGLLASQPNLSSIRQDLLPFLTQQRGGRGAAGGSTGSESSGQADTGPHTAVRGPQSGAADGPRGSSHDLAGQADDDDDGAHYMDLSHSAPSTTGPDSSLRVHVVKQGLYCARISDAASYGDVNRDLADAKTALHLTGLNASSQHDNVVPASTQLGNKSTIAAACILGENCVLGDKSSIKRSVLGSNCKLGANVKIINSVLQDNVVVGDAVLVQNSILCVGAVIKERATLKDCQVGALFTVAGGQDYNGEVLSSQPKAGA